jgi:uncharacterized repeat protein (TIGR01451 family)
MEYRRGRTSAWTAATVLACLLLPAAAAAQVNVPVILRITELVQLNHGQDPGVGGIGQSLGDFYAEVSINGTQLNNAADMCDNPPPTPPAQSVFSVPYVFFAENDPSIEPSCPPGTVPWTFVVDVPLSAFQGTSQGNAPGIPIVIRIKDDDTGPFNDDDTPATIHLQVTFDGRWTGDKTWPDNCNRDAVEGSGVRICWRIEVGPDSDGDGLLDDWEMNGLDVDGDGTIDLDLPAMGANPFHKDLFVELDWRTGFPPRRAEIQKWKEAFAAAPIDAGGVPNPDGLPGITLHVDTGALTENGLLVGDNLGGGNDLGPNFYACSLSNDATAFYPAKRAHFDAARRGLVFRYAITSVRCCMFGPAVGQLCTEDAQCPNALCQPNGGQAEIGGNDLVNWNTETQGPTLMHELGHALNLRHGGDIDDNCKPNYLSVMNYDHPDGIQRLDGSIVLDFSPPRQTTGARGTAPLGDQDLGGGRRGLIEQMLSETAVLDPADLQSLLVYTDPGRNKRQSRVGAPVDWNGNGVLSGGTVAVNIDNAGLDGYPERCENNVIRGPDAPLTGYDDWRNISMPFIQFGESSDGPINPVSTPEPTDEQIQKHRQTLNTTDLAIAATGPAGPVEAGDQVVLNYTLTVSNVGINPALPAQVRDMPPAGAQILSHDPECAADAGGQLACDVPGFLPGETEAISLSMRATAGCQSGVPTPIVNRARVDNASEFAGPDPQPANNAASVSTAVQDTTPPQLTLSASPAVIWPPNHQFVSVTITVTTSDVCDSSPAIRLVSIMSNEGPGAPGSGQTSPDVQGATFGIDDRQFSLRAERSGQGSGRIYTITYEAEDKSGNVTTSSVTVAVPKSQGGS